MIEDVGGGGDDDFERAVRRGLDTGDCSLIANAGRAELSDCHRSAGRRGDALGARQRWRSWTSAGL
jgi:hypothetical protein